jgi:paromamine 6'-oxidase/6'''-hydroxyneomycin C oxidase/2'-deamino-2'-hydroxyparomamine 6'-oxidase
VVARAGAHVLPVRVEAIIADRPRHGNRVALADTTDETGAPRVVIDYTPHPEDLARLDYLSARAAGWMAASGVRSVRTEESGFERGSTHLHGTCRGGRDPRTSVCDPWSRVHTVDNVFVADGAFMPFPGGLNPTLTIQAHALRTAERVDAELP